MEKSTFPHPPRVQVGKAACDIEQHKLPASIPTQPSYPTLNIPLEINIATQRIRQIAASHVLHRNIQIRASQNLRLLECPLQMQKAEFQHKTACSTILMQMQKLRDMHNRLFKQQVKS